MAVFLSLTAGTDRPLGLLDVIKVTLPASLAGVLAAALWSMSRGRELHEDPEFQRRLQDPAFREALSVSRTSLDKPLPRTAKPALAIFLGGVATIVLFALAPGLLPSFDGRPLALTSVLQMVMLAVGALLLLATGVSPAQVARTAVFAAGMVAVVAIFGIAWMSDTFVTGNQQVIVGGIKTMVERAPWSFAFAMFAVSTLVKSQAATLAVMLPFGLALGIETKVLLGVMPTCYAYFFFCFYPSDLAAISMDPTGTTRIGRYLLNHSFMVPGLIGVWVATAASYPLILLLF